MSTDATIAIAIFAVAMVGTLALGIAAMRGRDANLDEWTVGGRSFGVLLTWVLLAGECYTSFSYLGAAGWAYGYGAPIFYLVGYMATGYATVYLFAPMVWGYAKRHNLISITDIIAHRFGSKRFGAFVAIVATLALLPYIQLQIQGMGLVVSRDLLRRDRPEDRVRDRVRGQRRLRAGQRPARQRVGERLQGLAGDPDDRVPGRSTCR